MSDESAVELLIKQLDSATDSLKNAFPGWAELRFPMGENFINKLRSELNPLNLSSFSGLSGDKEKCTALCKELQQKYEDTYMDGGPGALISVLLNRRILHELMHIIRVYSVEFLGDSE